MFTLFQRAAYRLLFEYVGKAVPVYVQARNKAYTTLKHAALEKWATMEIRLKQTGQL